MLTHDDTYMYVGCTYVQDVCMYIMYVQYVHFWVHRIAQCTIYIYVRTYIHYLHVHTVELAGLAHTPG